MTADQPQRPSECRFGVGELGFACSIHHGVRLSLNDERCRKAERIHQPGDHHRYRIECEVCGQQGMIRLSIDPELPETLALIERIKAALDELGVPGPETPAPVANAVGLLRDGRLPDAAGAIAVGPLAEEPADD